MVAIIGRWRVGRERCANGRDILIVEGRDLKVGELPPSVAGMRSQGDDASIDSLRLAPAPQRSQPVAVIQQNVGPLGMRVGERRIERERRHDVASPGQRAPPGCDDSPDDAGPPVTADPPRPAPRRTSHGGHRRRPDRSEPQHMRGRALRRAVTVVRPTRACRWPARRGPAGATPPDSSGSAAR